jgi:lysozyme
MTNPVIVDLSHWNDDVDFEAMRVAGTIGVIHKATEGSTYVDPEYDRRRERAVEAGLEWASYHYLHHGDIEGQIQNYLSTVMPWRGLDDLYEVLNLLESVASDCPVTIYSGHLIKEQVGNERHSALARHGLWLAHYDDVPVWPTTTWPMWELWQYTDSEDVIGVSTPCDANIFAGGNRRAIAWFGGPKRKEPTVNVEINVTVTIGRSRR